MRLRATGVIRRRLIVSPTSWTESEFARHNLLLLQYDENPFCLCFLRVSRLASLSFSFERGIVKY